MPRRRRRCGTSRGRDLADAEARHPDLAAGGPLLDDRSASGSWSCRRRSGPVRKTNSPLATWKVTSFSASPALRVRLEDVRERITYSCAKACSKSAMRSSASSIPRESRKKPSGIPACGALLRRQARVRGESRLATRASPTPPRLGACVAMRQARAGTAPPPAPPPFSSIPSIPPKPSSIALGRSRGRGAIGESGVVHARDLPSARRTTGRPACPFVVLAAHAHVERLEARARAATRAMRIERLAPEPSPSHFLDQASVPTTAPAMHVGMAVQVLRGGVDHDVGAVLERAEVHGRGEGRIHHQREPLGLARASRSARGRGPGSAD